MNNSTIDNTDSQTLANTIVLEYLREKKRKRFWRVIKGFLLLAVVIWVFYQLFSVRGDVALAKSKPHVGLIDLKGAIMDNEAASGDNFIKSLEKAYKNESMKALIIRIDSPGGSPVQADYMFNGLKYYRAKYPNVKVYGVCVDMCASAAYYVAAATDEIYANPSSLVGSIGVIYNGFGFVDTMQKLGVSRRLQTAGRNKAFLDQFSPTTPEHQKIMQTMLDLIHQQFISRVKEGRGNRLVIDDETFSGLFWTGTQAKERGLIDGFASSGQLSREIIKLDKIIDYTYKDNVMDRLAKTVGAAMVDHLPSALGAKPGFQ